MATMMLEDMLDRIGKSNLSATDKQLALRTLAERGMLQNAPSQRFNPDQHAAVLGSLVSKGIIPQMGMMESGQVALPQPTPDMDRANAMAQQTEPTGAGTATPAPVAGGPMTQATGLGGGETVAAPAESPQTPAEETGGLSLWERIQRLGSGALATGSEVAGQAGEVIMGMTGAPEAAAIAQDPATWQGIGNLGRETAQAVLEGGPMSAGVKNIRAGVSDLVAPTLAEMGGAAALGAVGGAVAGPPGMAVGAVVGAGLGGAGGLLVGRTATGQTVSASELGTEAVVSFLPEFLESSARAVIKHLAKNAPEAQRIVENMMSQWATTDAAKVFGPPNKETVDQLFEMVHKSGATIHGDDLANALGGFDKRQWSRLKNELQGLATKRYGADFGAGMAETLDKIRGGAEGVELHIGRIQDLRSQLIKTISHENPTADDLAKQGLVDAFDRETNRMLSEGSSDAKLLKEAREQWGRFKAADTLQKYVSMPPVSRYDRAMEYLTFDLGKLGQILREPKGKVQQQIAFDLQAVPGADKAFREWLGKMKGKRELINVSTTGLSVNQLMGIPAMLGTIIVNHTGRDSLEKMLTATRGPLDFNKIAIAYSAARRTADIASSGQVGTTQGVGTQVTLGGAAQLVPGY